MGELDDDRIKEIEIILFKSLNFIRRIFSDSLKLLN